MALLLFLHHSHYATRPALSNAPLKCSWIQATNLVQDMARIATQNLRYLPECALDMGTKLRSKLGRPLAPKYSNLLLCFSQMPRELWLHCSELICCVLAFCGIHSTFMIQIATQKLTYLSKYAWSEARTIIGLDLGRLTPSECSKLSLCFSQMKALWVYFSRLICRVLALCGVHSVSRRWRRWICILILISLCITCWRVVSTEQEFDAKVLPRRTRRLIQRHSGLT